MTHLCDIAWEKSVRCFLLYQAVLLSSLLDFQDLSCLLPRFTFCAEKAGTIALQDLFLSSLFTLLHLFKANKHSEQDR